MSLYIRYVYMSLYMDTYTETYMYIYIYICSATQFAWRRWQTFALPVACSNLAGMFLATLRDVSSLRG